MEGLTAQFTIMTGSAERASSVIKDISDFAAKTPFSKMGLADAGKTLMAFGMTAEDVVPTLKMLGDVAGADQNRLNSLALVFGQIQSTGRLTGGDLLQLINQGFNPLNEISKKTGISVAQLKDAMSQGAISANMVTAAFKAATSEGGLFFGNLEAQSQTLQGRISTLKDNFVTALQNMAEAFLPMLKAGVDMLIAFDWTPIVASVQSFAQALASIPFDSVMTWIRRLSILVIAFATRDLQKTLITAFVKTAEAGMLAFKNVTLSFTGFRNIAVAGARSIGMAMKTALGPIGIALMAIEGFVEAYNWLEGKSRKKATEAQKANARKFIEQQRKAGKTTEQVLQEQVGQQEGRKASIKSLQEVSAKGGPDAKGAEASIMMLQAEVENRASFIHALQEVYKEMTGLEFEVKSGAVRTPSITGGTKGLEEAFKEIEKSLNQMTTATKKQTKATEDNTRAQKQFDISALSRQAFDAAFNVKLREVTLGAL
jgi:tape measure domain-containing protein